MACVLIQFKGFISHILLANESKTNQLRVTVFHLGTPETWCYVPRPLQYGTNIYNLFLYKYLLLIEKYYPRSSARVNFRF